MTLFGSEFQEFVDKEGRKYRNGKRKTLYTSYHSRLLDLLIIDDWCAIIQFYCSVGLGDYCGRVNVVRIRNRR